MKRAGGGSIVNISSTSGKTGLPLRLPYAVSKHAVMGFTETLAREVGPHGIRVNTILPGFMNNERSRRIINAKSEALGITPEAYLAARTPVRLAAHDDRGSRDRRHGALPLLARRAPRLRSADRRLRQRGVRAIATAIQQLRDTRSGRAR